MQDIYTRTRFLEESVKEIWKNKHNMPVLFVRESPEGVYTYKGCKDIILPGREALEAFAAGHGTHLVIIDNLNVEDKEEK